MKKYLLISLLTFSLAATEEKNGDHIKFDSFVIKFIDGTPFIVISEIIHYAKNLFRLTKGTTAAEAAALYKEFSLPIEEPFEACADDKGRVGLVWFNGNYHTVKDLHAYEKTDKDNPDLRAALTRACFCFEKLSESYVSHIEGAKSIMIKLIDQWCTLRNRPQSKMRDWAKIDRTEADSLYKNMTTFEIFDIFLDDLLLFLKDFMHNCPKSLHAYKEQLKQQAHESNGKN